MSFFVVLNITKMFQNIFSTWFALHHRYRDSMSVFTHFNLKTILWDERYIIHFKGLSSFLCSFDFLVTLFHATCSTTHSPTDCSHMLLTERLPVVLPLWRYNTHLLLYRLLFTSSLQGRTCDAWCLYAISLEINLSSAFDTELPNQWTAVCRYCASVCQMLLDIRLHRRVFMIQVLFVRES